MTTYLIILVITFFTLLFAASKFNKKLNLYSNEEEKLPLTAVIAVFSIFWLITIPISLVIGFFYFVAKGSSKLLK